MRLIFTTLLLLSVSATSSADVIEKIIGEDDMVPVNKEASNIPSRYRDMVDAFGLLSMGCTGTHIGQGYVLTAGHCFWADEEIIRHRKCDDTTIKWGVREGIAEESFVTSKCEEIVIAQRDSRNDYAIIKVSPAPEAAIPPEMSRRAAIGDTLTIFSHPHEMPLRWSKLWGVEREQHPSIDPGGIHHKCDTNPGSSGASLIDAVSLRIIGVHDGGFSGTASEGNDPVSTGMNYGTYIMNSPLYDALKEIGF